MNAGLAIVSRLLFFVWLFYSLPAYAANVSMPLADIQPEAQLTGLNTWHYTGADTLNPDNAGTKFETVNYPDSIVTFARTLIGTPYLYASADPGRGFDCSGFITYVFTHFKFSVPRSSVNFTDFGKEISLQAAQPGDLVLFTGTDSTIRIVGHMGIVESIKNDTVYFLHSSSGKAKGVTISELGKYYRSRFVKIIRVFENGIFYGRNN